MKLTSEYTLKEGRRRRGNFGQKGVSAGTADAKISIVCVLLLGTSVQCNACVKTAKIVIF